MSTFANGELQTPNGGFQFTVHTLTNGRLIWIPEGEVGFSEVNGLTDSTEAVDYGEGNDLYTGKHPGRSTPWELTLQRGLDRNTRLLKWRNAVKERTALPKPDVENDVVVSVYARQGTPGAAEVPHELIAQWLFRRGWPMELTMADLKKSDGEINVISLKLTGYGPPEQVFPVLA